LVLLLGFLSSTTRHVAALIGGAGFGAFIDELGKFVTSDNDYFFKPTAVLVYVLFVVLFFIVREIRRSDLTATESLVNAIGLAEQLAAGPLSASERQRALELVARADQSDPLVPVLRERFSDSSLHAARPTALAGLERAVATRYASFARSRWFRRAIITLFALQGLGYVLSAIATLALLVGVAVGNAEARAAFADATGGATVTSWIQLVAGAISGAMIVRGMAVLRRSRSRAYRSFEIAVLVDLLLVQPFHFLDLGFGPAADVILDLVMLAILRSLHGLERGTRLHALETGRLMSTAGAAGEPIAPPVGTGITSARGS
jgi:hypothetical protein